MSRKSKEKSSWKPYKPTKKLPRAKTAGDIVGAEVKPGPREIGRNKKWKPAKYEIKKDEDSFLKPRLPRSNTVDIAYSADKKAGPREIGRNKRWKPAKYDVKEDEDSFLAPRLPRSNTIEIAYEAEKIKKAGPRDIGRNKRWKPAKYDVKNSEESFLAPRVSSASDIAYGAEKKAGPRDIGRNKRWKPAKYEIKKSEEDEDSFLKPRLPRAKSDITDAKIYKAGPRDIGRNKKWKPAKYVDLKAESEGDFLAERTSRKKKKSRSKSGEVDYRDPVVYKAGPREIGRMKGWKPAKYVDLKKTQSEGDFLAERTSKRMHARYHSEGERLYKAGPRDIEFEEQQRRMKGWKPAKYNINQSDKDFLAERTSKRDPVKRDPVRRERSLSNRKKKEARSHRGKADPTDIGRTNEDWKPARYETPNPKDGDTLAPQSSESPRGSVDLSLFADDNKSESEEEIDVKQDEQAD